MESRTPITRSLTIVERSRASQELWQVVMPCAPPDLKQFTIWAYRFTDALMQRAILRTSRKFTSATVPETVYRYVTGLLLNLQSEQTNSTAKGAL
jgi:hypothetical protein